MFVKVLAAVLFLGFFCVQLGTSLQCFNCDSVQSCKSPNKITCNSNYANKTNDHLRNYFQGNFSNTNSSSFDCFFHNYTHTSASNSSVAFIYKGCINKNIKACSLVPRNHTLNAKKCQQCSGNACNPAGTFSSSIITVFASFVVIGLCKVLRW